MDTCCDITHTIGFSYLEKVVRLAKYAWKQSALFWEPMGLILRKHIELMQEDFESVQDRMENFHKFFGHFMETDDDEVWDQCAEQSEYEPYADFLEEKLKKVTEDEEIDEIAVIAIKALNNYAGNLRSACSETNRNVIRKHVDFPF